MNQWCGVHRRRLSDGYLAGSRESVVGDVSVSRCFLIDCPQWLLSVGQGRAGQKRWERDVRIEKEIQGVRRKRRRRMEGKTSER